MSPKDLEAYGIVEGKHTQLKFEGGIVVEGIIITGKRDIMGKIQLISFKDCTVTYNDEFLFKPEWGVFDMAVGKEVVSFLQDPQMIIHFYKILNYPKLTLKKLNMMIKVYNFTNYILM